MNACKNWLLWHPVLEDKHTDTTEHALCTQTPFDQVIGAFIRDPPAPNVGGREAEPPLLGGGGWYFHSRSHAHTSGVSVTRHCGGVATSLCTFGNVLNTESSTAAYTLEVENKMNKVSQKTTRTAHAEEYTHGQ